MALARQNAHADRYRNEEQSNESRRRGADERVEILPTLQHRADLSSGIRAACGRCHVRAADDMALG